MFTRVIVSILALGMLALAAPAHAEALKPQSSNANGVSMDVTPRDRTADGTLAFEIALDTHSGSLTEDLQKSVVLIVDGKAHQPAAWKGDAPDGHHRKGVLTFERVASQPRLIELKVKRPGEPAPRIFRWILR